MKQEYQITEIELKFAVAMNNGEINFRRHPTAGCRIYLSLLGEKYGFYAPTVEPSAKGIRFLLAEPMPLTTQTTTAQINDYIQGAIPFLNPNVTNALKKIVWQLEFCDYQTSDSLHALKDNVAFIALKQMANTTFNQ